MNAFALTTAGGAGSEMNGFGTPTRSDTSFRSLCGTGEDAIGFQTLERDTSASLTSPAAGGTVTQFVSASRFGTDGPAWGD